MIYLQDISPDITNLTNLEKIDLSNNKLTRIPDGLTELTYLQNINLSSNQITVAEIPGIDTWLQVLEVDLSSNQASSYGVLIVHLHNPDQQDRRRVGDYC